MQLVNSFHDAAEDGDVITVNLMLRDGIPVDVSDGGDWTALHWAIMYNRTDVVKQLLHEGADVSRQFGYINETPLHYAAQLNNTEAARLLMGNGADINLKNYENKTPLDEAKEGSEVESLLLQLQQSAP